MEGPLFGLVRHERAASLAELVAEGYPSDTLAARPFGLEGCTGSRRNQRAVSGGRTGLA